MRPEITPDEWKCVEFNPHIDTLSARIHAAMRNPYLVRVYDQEEYIDHVVKAVAEAEKPPASDRFVERFGIAAARRWGIRPTPNTVQTFSTAMKEHYWCEDVARKFFKDLKLPRIKKTRNLVDFWDET